MTIITRARIRQMSPQFRVADLERSISFYTKVLGFDLDFRYEDFYAGVIRDGFSLHLKWDDSAQPKSKTLAKNQDVDVLFSVEGIESLYEELRDKQVDIVQHLREADYGKEFYIADPDGNVIAFLSTN